MAPNKQTACALGRAIGGKLLGGFAIQQELAELGKGGVVEAIVPLH